MATKTHIAPASTGHDNLRTFVKQFILDQYREGKLGEEEAIAFIADLALADA